MKRLLIACLMLSGCDRTPTDLVAPTAMPPAKQTSRVDPNLMDDSLLESLWLEHDIWDPNVQLCYTKPRMYCGEVCHEDVDYYTVMAPATCPDEPIE